VVIGRLDFRLELADCGSEEKFFYILSRLSGTTPENEGMLGQLSRKQ